MNLADSCLPTTITQYTEWRAASTVAMFRMLPMNLRDTGNNQDTAAAYSLQRAAQYLL
jgi:hypothetical protein